MRIFVLTQDEPFHLPRFFRELLEKNREIVGIGIGRRHNTSFRRMALRHYDLLGLKEFMRHGVLYLAFKAMDNLSLGRGAGSHSVKKVAAGFGVPVVRIENVNDIGFIQKLQSDYMPDLMISVSFSQILKKDVLAVPPLGCINLHSGLLPKYRGMLPTFWAMANGESKCGVTVHYMDEGIDEGKVLAQEEVLIRKNDTLNDLIARNKEEGLKTLLHVIENIRMGRVQPIENDSTKSSYFSFPKREDAMRFKRMGWKFR